MDFFTDEHRHPFFHTNNLWFDLEVLHAARSSNGSSVLGLPLIRNEKTVDPTDSSSPKVIQIETAMGAAIEVFEGAPAIVVGRDRFLPVKTTNDLLLLRSDAYTEAPDGTLQRATDPTPLVQLDPRFYRTMADFDARFPAGPPSLREATGLTVRGDWTFGPDVVVVGDVELPDTGRARAGRRRHAAGIRRPWRQGTVPRGVGAEPSSAGSSLPGLARSAPWRPRGRARARPTRAGRSPCATRDVPLGLASAIQRCPADTTTTAAAKVSWTNVAPVLMSSGNRVK